MGQPRVGSSDGDSEAGKRSSMPGKAPTLLEIQKDRITQIASENWGVGLQGKARPAFSNVVVKSIYDTELTPKGGQPVPLQRVMLLEISQYLENYLWPNFDPASATFEHVMSIILMVNEKFRENVPAWRCFHDREDGFPAFFSKVLTLKEGGRELTVHEKTRYLLFMINCFQSLEDEMVRPVVLKLVSLQLWHALSPGCRQRELSLHPQLEKHWRLLLKKEAKAAKAGSMPPSAGRLEVKALPNLLQEFLQMLGGTVGSTGEDVVMTDNQNGANGSSSLDEPVDSGRLLYCERFMEFLIDMLSQLPTRRFFRAVVDDVQLVVKCRLCALYKHPAGRLFSQLVDLVRFYQGFEINDHTGMQLEDEEMAALHSERLLALQRLCFKEIPKLRELSLSNIGSIEKRPELARHLKQLDHEELVDLVTDKLKLVPSDDPWISREVFLEEVVLSTYEKRLSQREAINELPLYPNEDVLWDENLVPSIHYTGEGCLALPKLNLQFLTFHDYMLRNFNLFRLESTYEIREDVADVLQRVAPRLDQYGETVLPGWARMGIPIQDWKITTIKPPLIGESKPAAVLAEVKYTFAGYPGMQPIRAEWDELKEHDVVFLLTLRAPDNQPPPGATPAEKHGLIYVRGCEVVEIRDQNDKLMNDFSGRVKREDWKPPFGEDRTLVVALDPAQYQMDVNRHAEGGAELPYGTFNLLMRRKPKENNFKAVLECIRDLMNEKTAVPEWLHDIFLGYGDPAAAQYQNMPNQLQTVDFVDTFLDAQHLRDSFPGQGVRFVTADGEDDPSPCPPFRVTFPGKSPPPARGTKRKGLEGEQPVENGAAESAPLVAEAYVPPDPGPYPQDQPKRNTVHFTPVQVEAIKSGLEPGLTLVVGPPGTGKTDTAVQILHSLYHNAPSQRTLLITHSNQALNDLFEKIMERDVPARYLLRLGVGEQELATESDFSRQGRVNAMLERRIELLAEVERLADTLNVSKDMASTCETAAHFWLLQVLSRWEEFVAACNAAKSPSIVQEKFPFKEFYSDAPEGLFTGSSYVRDMKAATACFRHLKTMFTELEECRAFELLKTTNDRSNYLMTKQAKIVAMTCTHAALKRKDFLELGFKYDNLLMEESAQILEIETFIPMLLQRQEDGISRLKRVILIGDHHQLPPVVKNMAFQKYSHMDQSLFTRFVRLGTPYVELNAQGRARPSIAKLYNWRYRALGDLPNVSMRPEYQLANAGLAHEFQLVDVPDWQGMGEYEPHPHFFQNLGEAEYVVSLYQYLRLLGIPGSKISILSTYNGQKALLRDVIKRRCENHPLFGPPSKVTTVDKFQGQQNDFVLLSLVRSRIVGHLRDVRRLVVAMSRSRLGLYIFGRRELFEQCYELQPTFSYLLQKPDKLALVLEEESSPTTRRAGDPGSAYLVSGVDEMAHIVNSRFGSLQQRQMAEEQRRQVAAGHITAALAHAQARGFVDESMKEAEEERKAEAQKLVEAAKAHAQEQGFVDTVGSGGEEQRQAAANELVEQAIAHARAKGFEDGDHGSAPVVPGQDVGDKGPDQVVVGGLEGEEKGEAIGTNSGKG